MIGAPGEWEQLVADQAAFYTGVGGGEVIWTLAAAAVCVLAIIIGGIQEGSKFRRYK